MTVKGPESPHQVRASRAQPDVVHAGASKKVVRSGKLYLANVTGYIDVLTRLVTVSLHCGGDSARQQRRSDRDGRLAKQKVSDITLLCISGYDSGRRGMGPSQQPDTGRFRAAFLLHPFHVTCPTSPRSAIFCLNLSP